jgi:hypothetical protein
LIKVYFVFFNDRGIRPGLWIARKRLMMAGGVVWLSTIVAHYVTPVLVVLE